MEQQIRMLNEKVSRMEQQISDLQHQLQSVPMKSRSAWKDFLLAFVVVYVLIHVAVLTVSFFA